MYFPLLRGRQFELLALRGLADDSRCQKFVVPIIEPVRLDLRVLQLANDRFSECDFHPYLIANPSVGELVDMPQVILDYLSGFEKEDLAYRPAFLCDRWILQHRQLLEHFEDVLLVCINSQLSDDDIAVLAESSSISGVVLFEPERHRSLKRSLSDKRLIRLDDWFEAEQRNADYLPLPPHKFSEENAYYQGENYSGYGDFTLLPMTYTEGGFAPRAVAIHWSFLKDNRTVEEIWVAHYTSVSNYSTTDVAGKFREAVQKLIWDREKYGFMENQAYEELKTYYDEGRYPGLGMLKKLSIQNHILVNAEYLTSVNDES